MDRAARLAAGDFVADLLRRSDAGRPEAARAVAALARQLNDHPHLRPVAALLDLASFEADAGAIWDEAEALALDLLDVGYREA